MGTWKVARVTDSSSSEFGSEVALRLRERQCATTPPNTHTHKHTLVVALKGQRVPAPRGRVMGVDWLC